MNTSISTPLTHLYTSPRARRLPAHWLVLITLACLMSAITATVCPAQNLLAQWKFSEATGTSTADSSGNGLTLITSSSMQWVTGVDGAAGAIHTPASALNYPYTAKNTSTGGTLDNLTSYTITGWLNIAATQAAGSRLLSLDNGVSVGVTDQNLLTIYHGTTGRSTTAGTIAHDTWVFFAITVDTSAASLNAAVKIYLGTIGSAPAAMPLTGGGQLSQLAVGDISIVSLTNIYNAIDPASSRSMINASLDDVRIYGTTTGSAGALDASQVETVYDSSFFSRLTVDELPYEKFDEFGESQPPSPWILQGVSGSGVSLQLASTAESPFTANSISGLGILVADTSTSAGQARGILCAFSPPPNEKTLQVTFDFRIDDVGNNNVVPTFVMTDEIGSYNGLYLALWHNGYIANRNPDGSFSDLQAITPGTWYHARLTISPLAESGDSYDLSLQSYGGTVTTYGGLPMRQQIDQAATLSFYNNNSNAETGGWAVDNVTVAGDADANRSGKWPFLRPNMATLRSSPRKVFAYYFPAFTFPMSTKDAGLDYFKDYCNPSVSGGIYSQGGGFYVDRPYPRPRLTDTNTSLVLAAQGEVRLAASVGLDGFLLDFLGYATTDQFNVRAQAILDNAAAVDPDFKIVIAAYPNGVNGTQTVTDYVDHVLPWLNHASAYRLPDGRRVLSCWDAGRWSVSWWTSVLNELASRGYPTAFIPQFNAAGGETSFAPISYGMTRTGGTYPVSPGEYRYEWPQTVHNLGVPLAVQTIQFQDARRKSRNFRESQNSATYRSYWESAINRDADWVFLWTWTDVTESTEYQPCVKTGFTLCDLTAYYATWFKQGAQPGITRDVLYPIYRKHSAGTVPTIGPMSVEANGQPASDQIEVLSFLKAPGTLEVVLNGTTTSFSLPAGISSSKLPLALGMPTFRLKRGGSTVIEGTGPVSITSQIPYQDMQYWSKVLAAP
jgi:hypothetical protein